VPGTILGAGVKSYRGDADSSENHRVLVHYEYTVHGVRRTSRTLAFRPIRGGILAIDHSGVTPLFDKEAPAKALASAYPMGKTVDVYYSPSDPKLACLEPGAPALLDLVLPALVLFGIGLAAALSGLVMLAFCRKPRTPQLGT
jgi:hypothetical protein